MMTRSAVPPGSFTELSCQKIVFDPSIIQLPDSPVRNIDLGLAGRSVRRTTGLEHLLAALSNSCFFQLSIWFG
jgi:hypothetical protein